MSRSQILLNYIRIFRIKDWFYITGLAYLGYFSGFGSFLLVDFIYLSLIAILYIAHGYSLNNYFDLKINPPYSNPKTHFDIDLKAVLIISLVLGLLSIVLSLCYSASIFILVMLGSLISFLYSSRFTRLKRIPAWNIILNSSGFTVLFLIGYFINKPFSAAVLYLSVYIWIGIIPSQLIHLVAHNDLEGNWSFSLRLSLILIYLFWLLWLFWTFLSFVIYLNAAAIFITTFIFCVIQAFIIEHFRRKECLLLSNIRIIRKIFTWMDIVLGGVLIYLFRLV